MQVSSLKLTLNPVFSETSSFDWTGALKPWSTWHGAAKYGRVLNSTTRTEVMNIVDWYV